MTEQTPTPAERDAELRHIRAVSAGVAGVAVGATVVMGFGIAWGDQQRVDQADQRDQSSQPTAPAGSLNPPNTRPAPVPQTTTAPTAKSGGS